MFRPNRTPRRPTRPALESLEGRTLLSATPVGPETLSLVPGYAPVSFQRVLRAIPAIENLVGSSAPAGATPDPVTLDLDRDGAPDAIRLLRSPGGRTDTLQILYAGGLLHPPTTRTMALDFAARQLLVGDFDGDGNPDIFVMEDRGDSSNGLLLMGRPDGLYDAYRHTASQPVFAVADLGTPGVDEFVYGDAPVAQAGASGVGLKSASLVNSGQPATDVQCVDLDGGGTRDVVMSTGDGSVVIYAGLGNGRFSSDPIQAADAFAGTGPVHVAFAHLADPTLGAKGDSPLDMVVASSSRSEVAVFQGLGGGRFRQGQVLEVGLAPSSVSLRDVTNDGIPDLIVTSAGSNSLWIFRGQGNGRFDDQNPLILPTGQGPTTAFVGDFDGASPNEIVTLDRWSNAMTFYRGATGPQAQPVQIASGGVGPTAAVVRDVNGDGYDDLIVANRDSGQVTLFYGGPNGLHSGQTIDRPGTHPAALAVGPGLQSSYQVYVLDDGGGPVEILSFQPPPADGVEGIPTQTGEAPKLEPGPEIRLVFQPASDSTADSVPVLLVAQPEAEEAGPVERPSPAQVPPAGPATGRQEKPTAAGVAARAAGEAVVPPESKDAAAPGDAASQRYLLGLEDIPAPALGAAADRAAPPVLPSEPEGQRDVESAPAESIASRAAPAEADAPDASGEVPTRLESEGVAAGDVLLAVVLALGLPGAWGEKPGPRIAGRRGGI